MVVGTDSHYLTAAERPVHKAYLNSKGGEREVDSFYELLDAKDSIHNAIFYYEVTPHQKCYFYINNDNNFFIEKKWEILTQM